MPKFIAEIGGNHNNDIKKGMFLIDKAKEAGFSFIKFQYFDERLWPSRWDEFKEMPVKLEHLCIYYHYAHSIGMDCGCSVFHPELIDIDFLEHVDFIKIASLESEYKDLIQASLNTGKPVIISTGCLNMKEISAIRLMKNSDNIKSMMHCVAMYPADKNKNMDMQYISAIRNQFGFNKAGYSDHSRESACIQAAVALGATTIEMHVDALRDGKPGNETKLGCGHVWGFRASKIIIERSILMDKMLKEQFCGSNKRQDLSMREHMSDPINGGRI